MDGCTCDRHPSARAMARLEFDNGDRLYLCSHCTNLLPNIEGTTLHRETVNI